MPREVSAFLSCTEIVIKLRSKRLNIYNFFEIRGLVAKLQGFCCLYVSCFTAEGKVTGGRESRTIDSVLTTN